MCEYAHHQYASTPAQLQFPGQRCTQAGVSAFPGWQLADMGCARIVEQGRTHVSTTTYGAPDALPAARDKSACTTPPLPTKDPDSTHHMIHVARDLLFDSMRLSRSTHVRIAWLAHLTHALTVRRP